MAGGGGDGTVPTRGDGAEVAQRRRELGIVPLDRGTTSRAAAASRRTPAAALALVAAGATHDVDVGLAWHPAADDADAVAHPPNDATALSEAAGVGLHAAGFGLAKLGQGTQPAAGCATAGRRCVAATPRCGSRSMAGDWRTAAPAVTVATARITVGLRGRGPDADPPDGSSTVVFSYMSRLDVIRDFLAVARGRPRREPRMRYLTVRRVRVESQATTPGHADGEPLGETPIAFTARPFALRIFALPGEAPPGT